MFDADDDRSLEDFGRALERAPDTVYKHVRQGFAQVAEFFLAEHRLRHLRGRPGIRPQHGQAGLAGSFKYEIGGNKIDTLVMRAFSTSTYARIHEFGGVIKARLAKYLRFKIGEQWVQVAQVTIPARLGFRKTWADIAQERGIILQRNVAEGIREAIQ